MKKLGFGMMRLPLTNADDPKSVNLDEVCRMVDTFLARGFTYFDTAYMYHQFHSEEVVREALVRRHPRESFQLADKLPSMFLKQEGDQERIFAEQLQKCGVDYFDYYLVHSLNAAYYETVTRLGSFEFVAELKRQGKVRKMGFSFHDSAEMLDRILCDHPEVDFVQIQLNYLDWDSENVQSRLCYETCLRHGKPMIVMEPVKGGMLANVPARAEQMLRERDPNRSVASWAIRFAASCPEVFMVLSGMSNMEQLCDNLGYMEHFEPLTDSERAMLAETVRIIHADIAVACTSCRYCVDGCPKRIDIPKCFALYNQATHTESEDHTAQTRAYRVLTEASGKASDCIRCKKCQEVCPQHIRITAALKKVAELFEK